jgi:membrane fusion protein, copper/silver efflux system
MCSGMHWVSLVQRPTARRFVWVTPVVSTFGLGLVLACAKTASSDASSGASLVPTAAAAPKAPVDVSAKGALAVLQAYEGLRQALAADDLSTARTKAQQLADTAATASGGATKEQGDALRQVADAAAAEAALGTADALAIRKQFGEVSRLLVTVVSKDASLQQGRFVFECPMAPGYRKWIQTDAAISNPYMGKRMLECGSASTWS